jgi:AraC-like DNA-binding protein
MTVLAEGDRSVLDAATEVGFDSLSGFNRAFKRLTGEQPGQYRRRVHATDFTVS